MIQFVILRIGYFFCIIYHDSQMRWFVMVCQSDDRDELTSERSHQDESSLLHSTSSHAELLGSSTPRQEVPLDTVDAAAAGDAGSELFNKGTCMFAGRVCLCVSVFRLVFYCILCAVVLLLSVVFYTVLCELRLII